MPEVAQQSGVLLLEMAVHDRHQFRVESARDQPQRFHRGARIAFGGVLPTESIELIDRRPNLQLRGLGFDRFEQPLGEGEADARVQHQKTLLGKTFEALPPQEVLELSSPLANRVGVVVAQALDRPKGGIGAQRVRLLHVLPELELTLPGEFELLFHAANQLIDIVLVEDLPPGREGLRVGPEEPEGIGHVPKELRPQLQGGAGVVQGSQRHVAGHAVDELALDVIAGLVGGFEEVPKLVLRRQPRGSEPPFPGRGGYLPA